MRKTIIALYLMFVGILVQAQNDWRSYPPKKSATTSSATSLEDTTRLANLDQYNQTSVGMVDTFIDAGITDLLNRYVADNKRPGYRIKIYSGRSSEEAKKAKEKFSWRDKETAVYTEWNPPNFVVKVGNFRSKLKALEMHNKIKGRFRNAYIIEEWVLPEATN